MPTTRDPRFVTRKTGVWVTLVDKNAPLPIEGNRAFSYNIVWRIVKVQKNPLAGGTIEVYLEEESREDLSEMIFTGRKALDP